MRIFKVLCQDLIVGGGFAKSGDVVKEEVLGTDRAESLVEVGHIAEVVEQPEVVEAKAVEQSDGEDEPKDE